MPTQEQECVVVSPVTIGAREFKLFRELIHKETGIWLRDGKEVMLASRLSSRLRHYGIGDFGAYYEIVRRDREGSEMRELVNRVTTNKTSFFRENQHFEFLTRTVVPERQRATAAGAERVIRIWSAASSTGEEVYTIVMTLLEALHQPVGAKSGWRIEVVGSDIDTRVLETARQGVYASDALESVPVGLRGKYFLRGKGQMAGRVKIRKEFGQLTAFKHINLMHAKWPLEGLFDAIFFRNALIYFNQQTQNEMLRKMLRYLKPKGYLFLGHSEHVPWLHDAVTPLSQTVYRLRETGR